MKTEQEILQAIIDLTPVLTANTTPADRNLAKVTIDILKWVLGRRSVGGTGLEILRQIRASEKAGDN